MFGRIGLGTWTWRRALALVVALPWVAWAVARTTALDVVGHPVVSVLAFTPYAVATSIVPVLVALVLRRWGVAVLAAAAMVALAAAVLPRATGGQPASPDMGGATLTVMSSNLLGGRGDVDEVLRLVRAREVDVLTLQELTPPAMAALDAAGAAELLPDRVVEARPGGAGAAVLARRGLVERTTPDPTRTPQPTALVRLPFARAVAVKVVHPFPPITRTRAASWRRKLKAMPSANRPSGPLRVIAGDFNATLDHDALRRLIGRGYVDAADATGEGLKPTWPVGRRRPGITIDHVLADRQIAVRDYSVHEIPGSDHRAIVAALRVPRN